MSEGTVPAHVPRWTDAKTMEPFKEDDRRHEVWAALVDFRERTMLGSAAHMLHAGGDDTDLAGLMAVLWSGLDAADAAELVEENRELIEAGASEIAGEFSPPDDEGSADETRRTD